MRWLLREKHRVTMPKYIKTHTVQHNTTFFFTYIHTIIGVIEFLTWYLCFLKVDCDRVWVPRAEGHTVVSTQSVKSVTKTQACLSERDSNAPTATANPMRRSPSLSCVCDGGLLPWLQFTFWQSMLLFHISFPVPEPTILSRPNGTVPKNHLHFPQPPSLLHLRACGTSLRPLVVECLHLVASNGYFPRFPLDWAWLSNVSDLQHSGSPQKWRVMSTFSKGTSVQIRTASVIIIFY